jgi:hypothetical protein
MTDTILEPGVIAPATTEGGQTPLSWSAAIAGAIAATAVTFMIVALGSGIGLSFASPYGSGPSVTTLTIVAAVWLVMAQTMGFATGGYLAARLRSPTYDSVVGETTFRDGAQGFVVWAIGVVAMAAIAGLVGLYSAATAAQVAGGAATAASSRNEPSATSSTAAPTDYFVDVLFRPRPDAATAGGQPNSATVGAGTTATPTPLNDEARAEVTRIVLRGISQGGLNDEDRAYLAQVVAARTGLPSQEAEQRVASVETKAREAAKEATDKVAKAGAMFSFWTFMSLLFGAAAATLAAILGGQLRDAEGRAVTAD